MPSVEHARALFTATGGGRRGRVPQTLAEGTESACMHGAPRCIEVKVMRMNRSETERVAAPG